MFREFFLFHVAIQYSLSGIDSNVHKTFNAIQAVDNKWVENDTCASSAVSSLKDVVHGPHSITRHNLHIYVLSNSNSNVNVYVLYTTKTYNNNNNNDKKNPHWVENQLCSLFMAIWSYKWWGYI